MYNTHILDTTQILEKKFTELKKLSNENVYHFYL